jgi:cytochrome P450
MALPPGPSAPSWLQLLRWIRDPFGLLRECQSRFGDAFSLRIPGVGLPFVFLASPEAVKEVFALSGDVGHAGEANGVLRPFLGDHSLLLLDGAEHQRQRKMMMPAFHGERMHAYGRSMLDLAHDAVDAWPLRRPFRVHAPLRGIALQVILRAVFGPSAGPKHTQLAIALTRALEAAGQPMLLIGALQRDLGPMSPWGRYRRLAARASALLREEITRARAEETAGRDDLLAMLIGARDESGRALDDDEVHDEVMTLLIAGHETTATALAWALRWLLPDGALLERLRREIGSAGEDPGRIARLDLLDRTVKEALRLQPVIPAVGRVLKTKTRLGGFDLPAGTPVAACIYLVHQRPSLYPDADRFFPDRYVTFKPAPWEWIPFGGGLRRCIGAAFAIYEMKMVLAAILPRVEASLAARRIRATRRAVTLTPSGGLPIVVSTRRPREAAARPS